MNRAGQMRRLGTIAALRVLMLAGFSDEPVAEVAKTRCRRECPASLAIHCRLHRGTFARLSFPFLSTRHRPLARSLAPCLNVEK